jgi:hypothetical protein
VLRQKKLGGPLLLLTWGCTFWFVSLTAAAAI